MNSEIRAWRVCQAQDGRGLLVYFDPYLEDVTIRHLTGPERADRLAGSLSLSASTEAEADAAYVPDHNNLFLDLQEDPSE